MDSSQSEPNGEGNNAALYLHVVVVSDCKDDDKEHGCPQHLVHGQAQGGDLVCAKEWIRCEYSMSGASVTGRCLHLGKADEQLAGEDSSILTILIASAYSPHSTRAARKAPRY